MTAVPHGVDLPHRQESVIPTWRTRLSAAMRDFWDAMRAAHHARIPS